MPTPQASETAPTGSNHHDAELRLVREWEMELDDYVAQMAAFPRLDVVEVFTSLAGMSARLAAVRMRIVRVETRRLTAFRTRQLDPCIEEIDRQFKAWSRIVTARQQEWEMTRGAV